LNLQDSLAGFEEDSLPHHQSQDAEHTLSKLSDSEKHQRGLDTFADLKVLLGTAN
jgi:hypothetical protein